MQRPNTENIYFAAMSALGLGVAAVAFLRGWNHWLAFQTKPRPYTPPKVP